MLQNQPGMFNGEAVLNPLPYVNIAINARARKQAREDAIDKYYQKLPDTINDKGVRDNEIPIINDIKSEIFDYGQKNKEALRNPKLDNGAAQHGLQQLFRKGQSVARLSQNAAKIDLEAGKFFLNKDNQYALNNDDYIADHDLHNLPVTDPRHKTLDLQKYATNRPFDKTALIKRNADIKYSDGTPEITQHPTDPLSQIVTTRPMLDDENKKALFARAADDLHNNPMFAKHIQKELVGTGQLQPLVKIAKDVFKIPEDQLTDEGLAAAYEYSLLPVKSTTQKVVPNKTAVMDRQFKQQQVMEGIRQANREKLLGMRVAAKDAGEAANDLWVERYINTLGEEAGKSTDKVNFEKGGKKTIESSIPVDAVMAKIFTRDGLSPDRITVTSDGTYRPIFYKRDKDGAAKKASDGQFLVDEVSSVPISKDQFKLLLGGKAGTKQLNKEMTVPSKNKVKSNPLNLNF